MAFHSFELTYILGGLNGAYLPKSCLAVFYPSNSKLYPMPEPVKL
jgi:hypothetical protein